MAKRKKGSCKKKRSKLSSQGRIQYIKNGTSYTSVVIYKDDDGRFCAPKGRDSANERKKKVQKERRKEAARKRKKKKR